MAWDSGQGESHSLTLLAPRTAKCRPRSFSELSHPQTPTALRGQTDMGCSARGQDANTPQTRAQRVGWGAGASAGGLCRSRLPGHALQTGKETRPRLQQVLLQNRPRQDRALKEFMTAPLSWKLLAQARLRQATDGPGQEGGLQRDGGRPGLKALGPLCRLGLCFASLKAQWGESPRSPMHPPLAVAGPGLTNASLPPDGHGPLLRCMLGGPACMGSHTRFQSILSPCR